MKEKEYKNRNLVLLPGFSFLAFWVPIKIEWQSYFSFFPSQHVVKTLAYNLAFHFIINLRNRTRGWCDGDVWKFVKIFLSLFFSLLTAVWASMEKFETDVKIIFHLSHNKSEELWRFFSLSQAECLNVEWERKSSQLVTSPMFLALFHAAFNMIIKTFDSCYLA